MVIHLWKSLQVFSTQQLGCPKNIQEDSKHQYREIYHLHRILDRSIWVLTQYIISQSYVFLQELHYHEELSSYHHHRLLFLFIVLIHNHLIVVLLLLALQNFNCRQYLQHHCCTHRTPVIAVNHHHFHSIVLILFHPFTVILRLLVDQLQQLFLLLRYVVTFLLHFYFLLNC